MGGEGRGGVVLEILVVLDGWIGGTLGGSLSTVLYSYCVVLLQGGDLECMVSYAQWTGRTVE